MNVERAIRLIGGGFVAASVVAGMYVHPGFYWFTLFVGLNHGGPTLIACGSPEQKSFHLPRILRGDVVWCQGFSEPGAGSDVGGFKTHTC